MLFERLPEPVDALRSRNNTLRNLAALHLPREFNFCMTHVKGFQIGTLLSLDHGWPTFRGHGCAGHRMLLIHGRLLIHERDYGWAWMHWLPSVPVCS